MKPIDGDCEHLSCPTRLFLPARIQTTADQIALGYAYFMALPDGKTCRQYSRFQPHQGGNLKPNWVLAVDLIAAS
jgi:hypothetical protein